MKLAGILGATIAAVGVAAMSTAEAKTRIVVLASDYSASTAERIANELANVFAGVTAGDRLIGIRGGSGDTIFQAIIPNDPLYASHQGHRDKLLNPAWMDAMSYLEASIAVTTTDPVGTPSSQIDFPGSLGTIGYYAAENPEVVFFGDARYFAARQPDFSMVNRFPTDGHYSLSRSDTPFGVVGMEGTLNGVRIHFCMTADDWVNDAHKEGVHRTHALLAAAYGAQLTTFSADLTDCAARFAEGKADGARKFERNADDHRFGMVDVTLAAAPTTPVVEAAPAPVPAATAPDPLAAAIASGAVTMEELFLYDTNDEDGDEVEIVAQGFSYHMVLTKKGETMEVPLTQGALQVIGVVDGGGGGVTVGIRTKDGRSIVSDKIPMGESVAIPINTF